MERSLEATHISNTLTYLHLLPKNQQLYKIKNNFSKF